MKIFALSICDVGTWKGWAGGLLVVLGVVPGSPERGGQHFPPLELVTSAADAHGHGVGPILLRAHHARADTLGFIETRHTWVLAVIERFIGVEVEEKEAQAQQVWIPPVGRVCVIPILRHFRPKNARHNLYFFTAHGILTYLGSNMLVWVQKPSLQVTLEHIALELPVMAHC
jgi:hypothetical protein